MMDTEILDLLDQIGRSSNARLSQAVQLPGDGAEARRHDMLRSIRNTVLPRRLEFTAENGDRLTIGVNSSRVTDVFAFGDTAGPDFNAEPRQDLAQKLAQMVTTIAAAPGPLALSSQHPGVSPRADDVGITLSEIEAACADIPLPAQPRVELVSDRQDLVETPDSAPETTTAPQAFYDGMAHVAQGRGRFIHQNAGPASFDGACEDGQQLYPGDDLVSQLASDLAAWETDAGSTLSHPQLIVMRPAGGHGTCLTLFRDEIETTAAIHETRKLGSVVSTWKSNPGVDE